MKVEWISLSIIPFFNLLEIEDTKNWLRFQIYLLCETCYIFKDNQLFAIPIKITIYSSPPILCNFNKNIRCINYSGSTNIIKVTNLSIVHILLTLLLHINMMRVGLHRWIIECTWYPFKLHLQFRHARNSSSKSPKHHQKIEIENPNFVYERRREERMEKEGHDC